MVSVIMFAFAEEYRCHCADICSHLIDVLFASSRCGLRNRLLVRKHPGVGVTLLFSGITALGSLLHLELSVFGAKVNNFCLTEDDVTVAGRVFVNIRLGDLEHHVLRFLQGHSLNAGDELHSELDDGLAGLLLATTGSFLLRSVDQVID